MFSLPQGEYATSEEVLLQSLAWRERLLGSQHPDLASSLNALGLTMSCQHKDAEALEYFRTSLHVREEALGSGHPECGTSLNNVATALLSTSEDFEEAERLYMRSLTIKQRVLGPQHPDVALTLNNIAVLMQDRCRCGDALSRREDSAEDARPRSPTAQHR